MVTAWSATHPPERRRRRSTSVSAIRRFARGKRRPGTARTRVSEHWTAVAAIGAHRGWTLARRVASSPPCRRRCPAWTSACGRRAGDPTDRDGAVVAVTPVGGVPVDGPPTRHDVTTLPRPAVVRGRRHGPPIGWAHRPASIRAIGRGQRVRRDPALPAGDRMRRINWPRSVRTAELQVNSTWADLDTHIALVIDASDDFGVSEGIDGLASSLDGAVRAGRSDRRVLRAARRASLTADVRGDGAHAVQPGTGRAQLRRILEALARVRPPGSGRASARGSSGRRSGLRRRTDQ